MKTKLLKKFRAKYQVKGVDFVVKDLDFDLGEYEYLQRRDFFVVDKKTGHVYSGRYESIGEAIRAHVLNVVSVFNNLPDREQRQRIIEQNKLKRLVKRGRY